MGRLSAYPCRLGVAEDAGKCVDYGGVGEMVAVACLAGNEVIVWEGLARVGTNGAESVSICWEVRDRLKEVMAKGEAVDVGGWLRGVLRRWGGEEKACRRVCSIEESGVKLG